MKLLIITQKMNSEDPILGFFVRWVQEFAKHCEKVTVICLEKGKYDLPENVKVLSLGKERGNTKFDQLMWFYQYIWDERNNYDKVFVHMNPEWLLLGGLLWKILKKKVGLWYVHKQVNPKLWIAEKLADLVFTSAPESFGIKSEKVNYVGHGINTVVFKPVQWNHKSRTLVHVGRITQIKNCEVLIEALSNLHEKDTSWRLLFIGEPVTNEDGLYLKKIKQRISDLKLEKFVEFVGPLTPQEINKKFSESFASLNAAPTGGMDKAVLESWASGCPAFASNPVFADFYGKHASVFTYQFKDDYDLASKIENLISNKDSNQIVSVLSKKVGKEYSVKTVVDKISKILHV